jgi:hypothetical protein
LSILDSDSIVFDGGLKGVSLAVTARGTPAPVSSTLPSGVALDASGNV